MPLPRVTRRTPASFHTPDPTPILNYLKTLGYLHRPITGNEDARLFSPRGELAIFYATGTILVQGRNTEDLLTFLNGLVE